MSASNEMSGLFLLANGLINILNPYLALHHVVVTSNLHIYTVKYAQPLTNGLINILRPYLALHHIVGTSNLHIYTVKRLSH